MDFPGVALNRPVFSIYAPQSLGTMPRGISSQAAPISAVYPTANLAIYVPFVLSAPYPVAKVFWANGTAVAGNVDCGIYSSDGVRLGSIGSTAQAGTSVVQAVALSLYLTPGNYYMALACSSTTATFFRTAHGANNTMYFGMAQQATALPLPATATFATAAGGYLPTFGFTYMATI